MEQSRVLIVCDSPDRRNFLQYYVKSHGMTPIWYPNIFAARKALSMDTFFMLVVDLSIPIELKLNLIKDSREHQPHIRVMTLGKRDYLEREDPMASCSSSSVISLDAIDSFPDELSEYMSFIKEKM